MGDPDALGPAYERSLPTLARRARGAHYTPAAVADELVAVALDGRAAPRVLDPACGGGAFLLAAARALQERGLDRREVLDLLHGVDVDATAIATARQALTAWAGVAPPAGNLVVADALTDDLPWSGFDVVVGNPPFLTPLAAATARTSAQQARLRERFGAAVTAYTDAAALFLLLAVRSARAGGRVVLIQPQSLLAARDASAVRAAVTGAGALVDVWTTSSRVFDDAAVHVCAPVIDVASPVRAGASAAPWSAHLAQQLGVPDPGIGRRAGTLGSLTTPIAGFRDEYYGMVPHVREHAALPGGAPLVTSGLIDLGSCAWGERTARVAKQRWTAPVVDVERLEGKAAAWVARTRGPKLVVASQTKVVEAAVDELGHWVAGIPVVVVPAERGQLWRLAAAVCAPPIAAWAAHQSAGTALTPGALKISAGLIAQMPLPADASAWERGAGALRRGDLDGFGAAMTAAYGAGDEVLAWWTARR